MKRLSLRMPFTLYTRIATLAKADRRSVHAFILLLLEQALAQKDHTRGPTDV
jgi:hypothetical protein